MTEAIIEKISSIDVPLPTCEVNSRGKIIRVNEHIGEVFIYSDITDSDFFAITGVRISQLAEAADGKRVLVDRNEKNFRLIVRSEGVDEDTVYTVFFIDVTGFENLKVRYSDEKICVCHVNIDNYDELISNVPSEVGMTIAARIDSIVRKWFAKFEGSVTKVQNTSYMIYLHHMYVRQIVDSKFNILDEVREIETKADFPASLSIGLGIGGKNILETEEFAVTALELALGRGGDQAVVKDGGRIQYYGGKNQTVEKGNKGKSRIVGHALKQLIEQSNRVLIMGHKGADMDAFGSSLGIYRMCALSGTEAHIVIDEVNDSLHAIFTQAKAADNYSFITTQRAEKLITRETLLIVLDTHRPSYLERPELLEAAERIVVIDHHRKAEDSIENTALSYIESYASSTAELVTEMLQYAGGKKTLIKLEAEALLAGMYIDTNRFAVKTGVRTFEAAAWLRRSGADTTEVKRFFQTDLEDFRVRAKCIAAAEFYDNGFAVSVCEGNNQDAQVINSQVADELLNIKGIKASFVAGRNDKGVTCVSARSLGDVNVQLIMEKLGGGGHLTTAGTQVECSPEEVINEIKKMTTRI